MFVVDELWHTSENKSGINGSSPNFLCFSNLVINISLFLCKYGNEQKLGILAISLCLYFSYPGSDKLYIWKVLMCTNVKLVIQYQWL